MAAALTPDAAAGIWGLEPVQDAAARGASEAIDAALRDDRLQHLRDNCSVLILGDASAHCDESRHAVARTLCAVLAERCEEAGANREGEEGGTVASAARQTDAGAEVRATAAGIGPGGGSVTALSFATSKRSKESQFKLAAADPAVVIYVVSVEEEAGAEAAAVAKALKKSLAHLMFTGQALGSLAEAAVCVVLANCASLRERARALEADEQFVAALRQHFPSVASGKAEDVLLGVGEEMEQLLRTCFKPKEVRSVFVEECLLDHESPAARTVSEQMLAIVHDVQKARLDAVEAANMGSSFENTVKVADIIKQQQQQQQQQEPQRSEKKQATAPGKGLLSNPGFQLVLFGLAVLVLALLFLRGVQDDQARQEL